MSESATRTDLPGDAPKATASEPAAAAEPDAALPPSAGRYQFVAELARGGMGVVYRATDTVLGREVAVKVLDHRFTADSVAARRFVDEARGPASFSTPAFPRSTTSAPSPTAAPSSP